MHAPPESSRIVAALILFSVPIGWGQLAAEESASAKNGSVGYLRVAEDENRSIALEMAVRTFKPVEGDGPTVGLVAVAHVADALLYETIHDYLGGWDLVLYESVMPPGARGPGGDTDEERVESTTAALGFVASLARAHHQAEGEPATDAQALLEFARAHDARHGPWVTRAMVDAWGNPVLYTRDDRGFSLRSLGADGERGGEDEAADIVVSSADDVADLPDSSGGIQAQLAEALGLEFQLSSLDYAQSNWVCSDMAMDEVDRELKRRGEDFAELKGALSGSSLSGQMAETMLKMLPMIDAMLGGGMKDMMKVLLIEVMGGDDIAGSMMEQQMGSGFMEVIVGERNQAVIDDLKAIVNSEDRPESIGLLYGAAHMNDMEARLVDQLGYRRDLEFWMRGISVDLSGSSVSGRQIRMIRGMLKSMMKGRR